MARPLWKNLLQTAKERILQQRRLSLYSGAHGYKEELIKQKLQQFAGGSINLSKEDNGIGILTLNNPKLMNAFTGTMMVELQERITELENWKEGKGLIVYGAGNTFCSGSDLNAVKEISNSQPLVSEFSITAALNRRFASRIAKLQARCIFLARRPPSSEPPDGNPEENSQIVRSESFFLDFGDSKEYLQNKKNYKKCYCSAGFPALGAVLGHIEPKRAHCGVGLEFEQDEPKRRKTAKDGMNMCMFMQNTLTRLMRLPLISVALVQGKAFGGGAELTTACDFRLMTPGSEIRFVHKHMGLVPGWGGAARLVRIVGSGAALQLLSGAARVDPEKALRLGFSEQTLSSSDETTALEEAQAWLSQYTEGPVSVIQAVKKVVTAGRELPLEDALRTEKDIFGTVWGGPANLQALVRRPKHK